MIIREDLRAYGIKAVIIKYSHHPQAGKAGLRPLAQLAQAMSVQNVNPKRSILF